MRKEIIYCLLVGILSFFLLLNFTIQACNVDLGAWCGAVSWVSSPVALASGFLYALIFGPAYPRFNAMMSKRMLQWSVVGLGLGMNLQAALASGSEGMLFTIVSVFGTLALGWLFGRKLLHVDAQTSYLLSSGTAICGGSAIAAVGPIIKAKAESMSVALAVVFVLNAIALFVFPLIGDALEMNMKQFGMWAAIAIHDTSSVVGAGAAYDHMHPDWVVQQGVSALEVATTVKLTRALWIVVLAIVTPFLFRSGQQSKSVGQGKRWYQCIPRFIVWFIIAIVANSYVLSNATLIGEDAAHIGHQFSFTVSQLAKQSITLSMFFIGASLTRTTLSQVGFRPLVQGVLLWLSISILSLTYIFCVD